MKKIQVGNKSIGDYQPTYFIADVAANHDGDLDRAIKLIRLAKEAGADAAKFQNFQAAKIVSAYGFDNMADQGSHQSKWKKSVFEVYKAASIPKEWTKILAEECKKAGIDYFSSPYDYESVDLIDPYVDVYKIGSGDVTWIEMLEYIARKGKPVLLATGAADIADVQRAMDALLKITSNVILMQCNTNYTGDEKNYDYINLNVLKTYAAMYPDNILGLSDHTHAVAPVLGAVALGARVIERHFTDDNGREGPDHAFAMNPQNWAEMVKQTRILERSLGTGIKKVEGNEQASIVVQQRSLRAVRELQAGEVLTHKDLEALRPAPKGALKPYLLNEVIGRTLRNPIKKGDVIRWEDL
jgi:sialic acid synthase SpsE